MPKTTMRNGWKRWTEDDVRMLRELATARVPKEVIGLRMGRSPEAVAQRAWLEGLLLRGRRSRGRRAGAPPRHAGVARTGPSPRSGHDASAAGCDAS